MTEVSATGPGKDSAKPAADALGIDVGRLVWRRSRPPGGEPDDSGRGGGGPDGGDPEHGGPEHGGPGADASPGAIEVAVTERADGGTWVLVRISADPSGRVLVYDQHEWECFLDGVRKGEFDLPG